MAGQSSSSTRPESTRKAPSGMVRPNPAPSGGDPALTGAQPATSSAAFNHIDNMFKNMANAIDKSNECKAARNRERARLREKGTPNVGEDEVPDSIPNYNDFVQTLSTFAANTTTPETASSKDPPAAPSSIPPANSSTSANSDVSTQQGPGGSSNPPVQNPVSQAPSSSAPPGGNSAAGGPNSPNPVLSGSNAVQLGSGAQPADPQKQIDALVAAAAAAGGTIDWSKVITRTADPSKYKAIDYHSLPPLYTSAAVDGNEQRLSANDIPQHILAMAHERLYIPLTMLTTRSLNKIRSNDALKFSKLPAGNGAGKYMLDVSTFPAEDSINSHDFLQAYQNWLAVVKLTSEDQVAVCWYEHQERMVSDEEFADWFPAWFQHDKALRQQWVSDKPAAPSVDSTPYAMSFERQRNRQGSPVPPNTPASGLRANAPAHPFHDHANSDSYAGNKRKSSAYRYSPYSRDSDKRGGDSFRPPTCKVVDLDCTYH